MPKIFLKLFKICPNKDSKNAQKIIIGSKDPSLDMQIAHNS